MKSVRLVMPTFHSIGSVRYTVADSDNPELLYTPRAVHFSIQEDGMQVSIDEGQGPIQVLLTDIVSIDDFFNQKAFTTKPESVAPALTRDYDCQSLHVPRDAPDVLEAEFEACEGRGNFIVRVPFDTQAQASPFVVGGTYRMTLTRVKEGQG